ncbi:MAG TPA: FCD domain-containing protein [Mycobacteriales bacterium]|jgi:DNA-binding FadR family transcriptional regulator|nr:FCD domain-containing protein [Mycobacteriales bacterium]
MAGRVAGALQAEIVSRGWPVGEALGSEAHLMERFGISRSVLREALRILESKWVAKPKPGPGGGLVVTAPDRSAVRDISSLYLDYVGFAPADFYEVWMALELTAVERLASEISADGIAALEAVLRHEEEVPDWREQVASVHTEIGRLSGNPVLELFLSVISDLARIHGVESGEDGHRWLHRQHTELVAAIAAGDALAAQRVVRRQLTWLRRHQSLLPTGREGAAKG